jgi:hypothetical protein
VRELVFEEGRATVALANGTTLSILNQDRNKVIHEAAQWSPSYLLGMWTITEVQAEPGNFECAILDGDELTETPDNRLTTNWVEDDGEIIYRNVTPEQVAAYIALVGEEGEEGDA